MLSCYLANMAPHTLSAFALAALVFTPGLAQSLEGYGTVNGGTTGGAGGTTTTVSAVAAFQTAVKVRNHVAFEFQ